MFREAGATFSDHRAGRYAYILDGAHMSIVISEFRKQCGENTALDPFSFIMESDLSKMCSPGKTFRTMFFA